MVGGHTPGECTAHSHQFCLRGALVPFCTLADDSRTSVSVPAVDRVLIFRKVRTAWKNWDAFRLP